MSRTACTRPTGPDRPSRAQCRTTASGRATTSRPPVALAQQVAGLYAHARDGWAQGLDRRVLRSTDLPGTPDGTKVQVAGMVVVRQRPGTAKGVVFLLLEDEEGTVNVIVPPPLYDRRRPLIRTAPLLRAEGTLERREGTINVVATDVAALEQTELPALTGNNTNLTRSSSDDELRIPPPRTRELREHAVAQLRAVAPAGHSFG